MPPRRKPTSTKQKKADQKLKRAVKRGDVAPPEAKSTLHSHRPRPHSGASGNNVAPVVQASRRLQSAFVKLPPHFLEETKALAANLPLQRPISADGAVFVDGSDDADASRPVHLACPRRPKWRFDMTKKEVEKNEEGVFKKWLEQTDALVEQWQTDTGSVEPTPENDDAPPPPPTRMPRSTSYFERNIEVWRQLWRVTEISQIILVLLDSRCPLLHYPPSLAAYLTDRRVILVLTKVDISGPARADAWSAYLRAHYPGLRVVQVESYTAKEERADHQGRKMYEPHLPDGFRQRLVEAVREVHAELLEPPPKVKENPDRLKNWKPPVKREINWDAVNSAGGGNVGSAVGGPAVPRPHGDEEASEGHEQEPEFLTIGLIGQPNVGKSSLLNALFGTHKVRASKTPGKTKHFQTLFWTPDVRLVDCPGLVMPNFVPMEMQVLAGILPISRVAAIPACIYHAAQFLPLERILRLEHPATAQPVPEDKRTWRGGARPAGEAKPTTWTAFDVLTAYALAKGWVTAKAGRPDVHRAGNAILRLVAEGRVAWAFWPPGTDTEKLGDADGTGVWIPTEELVDEESAAESEEESEAARSGSEPGSADSKEENESEDSDGGEVGAATGGSRFGALAMDAGEEAKETDSSESD